jgi:anoctamin-10
MQDYLEMVVQYGHVVLFSVVWPLAPLAAFLNNVVEVRADPLAIAYHCRRPIPQRADSIGTYAPYALWSRFCVSVGVGV